MRVLFATAAAFLVSAGVAAIQPTHTAIEHAVTKPAAEAHVVMTPPPDFFGSILVTR